MKSWRPGYKKTQIKGCPNEFVQNYMPLVKGEKWASHAGENLKKKTKHAHTFIISTIFFNLDFIEMHDR